jgi:ABC-type transport system substrate-binding protein
MRTRPAHRTRPLAHDFRRLVRISCIALVASGGLAFTLSAAGAADPAKVAHLSLPSDPPGFDPAGPTDAYSGVVLEEIFDRLLTYDYLARPAKLVPLASEAMPEIGDAGKTYTLRVRKGIYFTPDAAFKGRPRELTAQDFAYSCMRLLDPAVKSPSAYLFRGKIVGLDAAAARAKTTGRFDYNAKIAGLEVIDRYTLRFHLVHTDYQFGYVLAQPSYSVVAREVVEAYGDEIGAHPVGTGAYMLKEWVPGARIVLEANPEYRGFVWNFASGDDMRDRELVASMKGKTMPQIGRAEISIVEDEDLGWAAFRANQLDITEIPRRIVQGSPESDQVRRELRERGIAAYRSYSPGIRYASFNFRDPVVGGFAPDKVALRRAIAMAYDPEEEMRVVRKGSAFRPEMPIPPEIAGYDRSYRNGILFDPDAANRLLDQNGYRRGADGYRALPNGKALALSINSTGDAAARDTEQMWKKTFDRVGLRVKFVTVRTSEMATMSNACRLQIYSNGWSADYPDGENFMQLYYGANIGETNVPCYRSADYDRMYERSLRLPDSPERNALFVEMSRKLESDAVFVLQTTPVRVTLVQPWLLGHKTHPVLLSTLSFTDIDAAKRPH